MWMTTVYLVGVVVGVLAVDGGPATRVGLALLWPLGPLAFIATIAGLLVVAGIAFPAFGVGLAGAVAALWWALR
jgi:hypothetical protein